MSCDRFVIVAASEKLVESLGLRIGLPVEVIPFGWERTADRIALLGIEPRLRQNEDQTPFITDGGHYVLDCVTGVIDHPSDLAASLKQTVGVVDHGLFVGIAHSAMVIDNEDTVSTIARTSG